MKHSKEEANNQGCPFEPEKVEEEHWNQPVVSHLTKREVRHQVSPAKDKETQLDPLTPG